ncbi:MAG: hypothetical protein WC635_01080 [Bacteriovorax sp.]|jgi:hypothetical protein
MRTLTLSILSAVALLYGTQIYAAPNQLLQCLAKEEAGLHKEKNQGVLYRLNQNFLNELATSNDIALKKNYIDEVCKSKKHSPSVSLLRLLLLKEADIYDLSLSEVDVTMRPFKMGYINEFQKTIPHLFVQYISGLQAEMATADCLEKAIPELKTFFERLKYLEEEMKTSEVISDKKRIDKIFNKLEQIKAIKKNCDKIATNNLKKLKLRQVQKKEGAELSPPVF